MKITPETKSLAAIFQATSDNKYVIPIYQRNYSWKDEQIETLFDDIRNEDKGYYAGNLLINTDNGTNNVIDGQQRLTTMSIMLLAIYEKLTNKANGSSIDPMNPIADEVAEARVDIKRQLLVDKQVRLKLLDKDQKVWENLVKILSNEQPGGWGQYYLFKRYKYIRDELLNEENFPDVVDLLDFYKKLINTELLQISVPDISDAYQVFASLNSKGMPLTPIDLLKNIYLSKNGEPAKWNELKAQFTVNDEENVAKLTSFILNNYDAFESDSTSSLTKGKIVKAYGKLFQEKGSEYIDVLNNRAKIYVTIANDENNYDWTLSGLAKLDATTSYPFLLNLLTKRAEYELTDRHIDKIVVDLIKLYVLRNIALSPKASNLRSVMNGLKKSINDNSWKSDELVEKIHEKIISVQPRWEAVELALRDGIYDKNKKTARFILISIERKYGKFFNKSKPDTLDDFASGGNLRWSIEHIIPQGDSLSDEWKDILSPEDRDRATEIQSQNVHKLGNLTLTPYNSEMGNKTFNEKKNLKVNDELVGLSLGLYLNESIDTSKEYFDISDLERRQVELLNVFKKLFSI
ncbi:DUF262 domain-containing HNH endonuclease family protein [Leuconostoc lactis]|uniref:DUF262 domain-containing protein n=1 Tax=Leuconostoc lactis TaxID=1246 RepID=UPI00272B70B9|nr:DUF262 domain-containing HNH endonuclease family protein [Leuconostoc lactis]WKY79117.1 DUF262 domain-containing HNH endonuclease family protein [Leuconostoc lactis]